MLPYKLKVFLWFFTLNFQWFQEYSSFKQDQYMEITLHEWKMHIHFAKSFIQFILNLIFSVLIQNSPDGGTCKFDGDRGMFWEMLNVALDNFVPQPEEVCISSEPPTKLIKFTHVKSKHPPQLFWANSLKHWLALSVYQCFLHPKSTGIHSIA